MVDLRLVHTYDASISINASINTRKRMCEPGRRKHKRKHKKRELFPSSCACACACVVMSFVAQAQAQAQEQIQAEPQEKLKYFLSADKQTNVSSPTLTVTHARSRWKLRRNTAPAYVPVLLLALVLTSYV